MKSVLLRNGVRLTVVRRERHLVLRLKDGTERKIPLESPEPILRPGRVRKLQREAGVVLVSYHMYVLMKHPEQEKFVLKRQLIEYSPSGVRSRMLNHEVAVPAEIKGDLSERWEFEKAALSMGVGHVGQVA